ncbi:hypothetical protein KP509_02G109900 [Ceratopteris richardii]|uniref:Uncharacterized protein n=1 Tax=Ceratopteris richardii TaxID=49495 RepID=A0A8T2VH29_CERRI|nr:hypothetical protein KP509_02G109900 [Ceratopteris richardii]
MTELSPYTPKWGGINLQTAENLNFASSQQLFHTYLSCVPLPVSPSMVHAWLMGSYKGPLCPQGFPDGEGSAILPGRLSYAGGFKHGLLHGNGILAHPDGKWSYTGSFSYNCIHGFGMYRWENNGYYNGQIYQGLPHGDGLMFTGEEDCCTYEGGWKHGLRHGQGKLTYGSDCTTIYEGRWMLDRKHGDGYHTYDSGINFKGSWSYGKRHGKGRLLAQSNGNPISIPYRGELARLSIVRLYIYEGDWMDDLSSGRGKSIWMSNEQEDKSNRLLNYYVGDFKQGLRDGKGTFYYASGAIYKGEWMENRKHGLGCYINESGSVLHGCFSKDRVEETFFLKEPLQTLLECEENSLLLRENVFNVLARHNSFLKEIFTHYSNLGEEEKPTSPCPFKAMFLHQFWKLCHDANIVQPELGLAQIDWLLHPNEFSWDESFEIHKPGRQIIFREFIEAIVIISKQKFSTQETMLDEKVDNLIRLHLAPVLTRQSDGVSNILMDVCTMQIVFDGYSLQLEKLFNETLRGYGTSDDTILLYSFDIFAQRYKPQWGLQRERLMAALIKGLYQFDISPGDDGATYLKNDINFMEFKMAIYIYATTKEQGATTEPTIMLNAFIKEVILPNLTTKLETLLNEDTMPNLPNISTKGSSGNATGKTPRSVPGSKKSTPIDRKIPAGAKSAPQTPLKKKS